MSEEISENFADLEIVVEFQPLDDNAAELLKQEFAGDEVFESNAFSGEWVFTIILLASKGAVGKVVDFFATHRQRFKDATVKIGKEEISLTGYSKDEVLELFESKSFQKALTNLKTK